VHLIKAYAQKALTDYPAVFNSIEVSTVDGFQGREKDIIIVSCVRSSSSSSGSGGIGFLRDVRRLNVAITRAKFCMWIIGDSKHLQQDETWRALVLDAKARGKCA